MIDSPKGRAGDGCEAALSAFAGGGTLSREYRAHIAGCDACRKLTAALTIVAAPEDSSEDEDCPPYEVWLRLAAGLEDAEESDRLLEHAASCDGCGAALRAATEDINGPAVVPISPDKRPARLRFLPYAAAAAAVFACGYFYWSSKPDAETLIARAYTASRPSGFRVEGAPYGPIASVERAADTSNIDLLRAEAMVLEGLKADPSNRHLLILRSRVDLLRRRYDNAVATLQGIVDANADTTLLTEFGIAYLARAGTSSDKGDALQAVEYLSRALSKDPNNEIALFNRAMAQESLFLWDGARRDWEQYLQLKPTNGWAAEAREHLSRIHKKKVPGTGD